MLYPLETVKTRMQSDHIQVSKRMYSSLADCFRKTYVSTVEVSRMRILVTLNQAENGIPTFFKGYMPSLARALPVNSAIFCAVFAARNELDHYI